MTCSTIFILLVLYFHAAVADKVTRPADEKEEITSLIKGLKSEVAELKKDMSKACKNDPKEGIKENDILPKYFAEGSGNIILFTGFMDEYRQYAEGVLPFRGILSNHGNAYNSTTSTFTCPLAGVYEFYASITYYVDLAENCYAGTSFGLRKNEEVIALRDEFQHTYNTHATSVKVMVDCNEGDTVNVVNLADNSCFVGYPDIPASIFSGKLEAPFLSP